MNPSDKPSEELNLQQEQQEVRELDFSGNPPLLSCPKCNHFISGNDINIESTIAKCGHCHHVFGFEHDSGSDQLKPSQIIPDGMEVLKLRSELDMRLRWLDTTSKSGRRFLTLFTGLWNLMLLPFVFIIVLSGSWGILLFLSLHLLVGLGMLWQLASIYMNRTSISVTKNRLKVRTIPLKHYLWKNRDIDAHNLKQLYVTKYVQGTTNGVPNHAYALYAIMKDTGEKIALLRGMNRESQVYIEREIENYLGIKNRKVAEEETVSENG